MFVPTNPRTNASLLFLLHSCKHIAAIFLLHSCKHIAAIFLLHSCKHIAAIFCSTRASTSLRSFLILAPRLFPLKFFYFTITICHLFFIRITAPANRKNFEKGAQINTRLQIIEPDATRITSNASDGYPAVRKAFIEHQLKEITPLQP